MHTLMRTRANLQSRRHTPPHSGDIDCIGRTNCAETNFNRLQATIEWITTSSENSGTTVSFYQEWFRQRSLPKSGRITKKTIAVPKHEKDPKQRFISYIDVASRWRLLHSYIRPYPLYFPREQFSTIYHRRRVGSSTSCVSCAACARLRRALDAGKYSACLKPAPGCGAVRPLRRAPVCMHPVNSTFVEV